LETMNIKVKARNFLVFQVYMRMHGPCGVG
jgi:hypothetical protein